MESWHGVITLLVLALTVTSFISGKFRADITALCALLALMITGVLSPAEALSGFSNPVIPSIAALFVISGTIVRSGLATRAGERIIKLGNGNQNLLFMLIMLVTIIIGSMVSNTGTVAIMMPIVGGVAHSLGVSQSRFLMPLAFMSSVGGMLTLIGNPCNMVVNDMYAAAGYEPLTLFSFLPVGLVCLGFGMLVIAPATAIYLRKRKSQSGKTRHKAGLLSALADKYHLAENLYELTVPASSAMAGKTLAQLDLPASYGAFIQEIRRRRDNRRRKDGDWEQFDPPAQTVVRPHDTLLMLGQGDKVYSLAEAFKLGISNPDNKNTANRKYVFDSLGICELVLMSSSRMVNRTVEESGLRQQFNITVLGIQRKDKYIMEDLKKQVLNAGDALLVQGTWEDLQHLSDYSEHWVVVGRPQDYAASRPVRGKIPYVLTVLVLMMAVMGTGLLPTVATLLLAAVALGVGGCLRNMEETYSSISWETLVMVGCMLPMAVALKKIGAVSVVADLVIVMGGQYGPWLALAVIYAATSLLNIVISSTPIAVVAAPVALKVAVVLGVSPLPFMFAVATAACMCFASPFSTPSNALVVSAGGYTFLDYLKIGFPLQALMGVVMVLTLPLLFPF